MTWTCAAENTTSTNRTLVKIGKDGISNLGSFVFPLLHVQLSLLFLFLFFRQSHVLVEWVEKANMQ